MRIKMDFVTNSSSTSYMISATAKFIIDEKEMRISRLLYDSYSIDCIKIIENELKYNPDFKNLPDNLVIDYEQIVEDVIGDGWDDGDYNFSGNGHIFGGDSELLEKIMTKKEKLVYKNGELNFPKEWVSEYEMEARFCDE